MFQVAELKLRLPDWSRTRPMVVGRRCLGDVSKAVEAMFWVEAIHQFEAFVTSLPQAGNQRLAACRT